MVIKKTSRSSNLELAYVLLRVTLGLNICMHGVVRWFIGLGKFAASLVTMFHQVPLPVKIVYGFGLALPVIESLVGLAVLIGFQTRKSLVVGMAVMLALTFGSTLHQDWQIAGLQLVYSLVYAVLLAAVPFNRYCVDRISFRSIENQL